MVFDPYNLTDPELDQDKNSEDWGVKGDGETLPPDNLLYDFAGTVFLDALQQVKADVWLGLDFEVGTEFNLTDLYSLLYASGMVGASEDQIDDPDVDHRTEFNPANPDVRGPFPDAESVRVFLNTTGLYAIANIIEYDGLYYVELDSSLASISA